MKKSTEDVRKVSESISILPNNNDDDETTIASEIPDLDEYVEEAPQHDFGYDVDVVEKGRADEDDDYLSRTVTQESDNTVVVADQHQKSLQQQKMSMAHMEDVDDLSKLIDNDEDVYELSDNIRSPSPRIVNYLTNTETHSSYLRRQRLQTASTLDLPVN